MPESIQVGSTVRMGEESYKIARRSVHQIADNPVTLDVQLYLVGVPDDTPTTSDELLDAVRAHREHWEKVEAHLLNLRQDPVDRLLEAERAAQAKTQHGDADA
ncbi:hypothetical protein [Acrocarpospora sp. B8E8]|uniref:hypothetical protein n=1 Tax=Acrocarpospora sp. B8E8 TaxID=3153572 RepID=UPI00325E30CF